MQDRLLTYGDAAFTYTSNGELRLRVVGTDTTRYHYDALGNLLEVTLSDGTLIEYVVDGLNRRVGKKVDGTLVQGFLYQDQLNPVAELDGSGQVVSRFVYGSRSDVPDYMIKNFTQYRIISDHLGSVRLVVDWITGAVVQRLEYDEFGRVLVNTNPGFQPFGYAGGLTDEHTGLIRFGARDYDPSVGRWTAKDPVGFASGSLSLFAYVAGDPLNYLDPTGLFGRDGCPEGDISCAELWMSFGMQLSFDIVGWSAIKGLSHIWRARGLGRLVGQYWRQFVGAIGGSAEYIGYSNAVNNLLTVSRDLALSGARHLTGGTAVGLFNYAGLRDSFGENYYGWDNTLYNVSREIPVVGTGLKLGEAINCTMGRR